MTDGYRIGTASTADLRLFRQWAAAEGWNPGRSDPLAFQAADPGGFFTGRLDGEPVASLSGVRYGRDHAFLGLYMVRPELRGRGLGLRLWRAVMEHVAGRNTGLDGVAEQRDNYRRSGFRAAWEHIRYEGVPAIDGAAPGVTVIDGRSVPLADLLALDRRYFPAPRDAFLSLWVGLPEHVSLAAVTDGALSGFAVLRPTETGARVGPVYAASEAVALALIGGLAARVPGSPVALDVPDVNAPAVRLAERLGLRPSFACTRMYTGPVPDVDLPGIWAATSVELG
ncbi:GNAT family N-acetyltransferase [Streptomyces sp. RFCAC02]|uniref:GNAT family N-acetyltransferase n=1 Tax=Streptomyces sp. RFCAC02 TaxID=2499143 RepID=UPI001020384F|nr:GNAT family N-acetyltransferase [Streptomyces sp. RFCAC02]